MAEYKKITKCGDLEGRTIAQAENLWDVLGLRFEDGSFVIFEVDLPDAPAEDRTAVGIAEFSTKPEHLLRLGVIDEKEHEELEKMKTAKRRVRIEAEEREEYDRLKAKFEGDK